MRPSLVNIALDLQITICTLLHPSDILALRETCKILQLLTRNRAVWVAVLRRVCRENSLFSPSFPILDMSDVELERASTAPRRWIELCATFEKQHPNDFITTLRPRTTRIIDDSPPTAGDPKLFIVPGGRYMVNYSLDGVSIWDLGYTSTAACKLIASVGPEGGSYDCMVQATPDCMGLIILSSHSYGQCSVYEIYPQSETPQLTRIAHLEPDRHFAEHSCTWLLSDRVLWYRFNGIGGIVFSVWDYRMNYSISFSVDVDPDHLEYPFQIIATKTAIFLLCFEEILVWVIPPLSPHSPDFFDYHPTHITSLLGIAYLGGILHDGYIGFVESQTLSHWYLGPSQPLYFGIFCLDSKLRTFEIIVKPDLSDTSLHIINTTPVSHDFHYIINQRYSICEDTLVICWESDDAGQFGALTSSRSTITQHGHPVTQVLLSASGYNPALCPASGRYVHLDRDTYAIIVVDLL